TSQGAGHPYTFIAAVAIIVVWAVSGPLFGFSDTWQLVINTGTTIVTFIMVFLIQNTQNRDAIALHLKIDELIRATEGAHNALLAMEELSEADLIVIRDRYEAIAARDRTAITEPTDSPLEAIVEAVEQEAVDEATDTPVPAHLDPSASARTEH